jgi:hypothetical protein
MAKVFLAAKQDPETAVLVCSLSRIDCSTLMVFLRKLNKLRTVFKVLMKASATEEAAAIEEVEEEATPLREPKSLGRKATRR